jgi:hypothetical protein
MRRFGERGGGHVAGGRRVREESSASRRPSADLDHLYTRRLCDLHPFFYHLNIYYRL